MRNFVTSGPRAFDLTGQSDGWNAKRWSCEHLVCFARSSHVLLRSNLLRTRNITCAFRCFCFLVTVRTPNLGLGCTAAAAGGVEQVADVTRTVGAGSNPSPATVDEECELPSLRRIMNGGTWPGRWYLSYYTTLYRCGRAGGRSASGIVGACICHPSAGRTWDVGHLPVLAPPPPPPHHPLCSAKTRICARIQVPCGCQLQRRSGVFCAVPSTSFSYSSAPEVAKCGPSVGSSPVYWM